MATVQRTHNPRTYTRKRTNFLKIGGKSVREHAVILLEARLNKFQKKLNGKLLSRLEREFFSWLSLEQKDFENKYKQVPEHAKDRWLKEQAQLDRRVPENQAPRLLTDFLFLLVNEQLAQLDSLKKDNFDFRRTITKVVTSDERKRIILHYASTLGATRKQLRQDRKAFHRWFDEEAVTDRFHKKLGEEELYLAFVFERLGVVLAEVFLITQSAGRNPAQSDVQLNQKVASLWKRLSIETRLQNALVYDGDPRVHIAALKCLSTAVESLPTQLASELFEIRTLMFINRTALEGNSDVWVQCEALTILMNLSFEHCLPVFQMRMGRTDSGDDIFVRRHVYKLIERHLLSADDRNFELNIGLDDPSPFVRQKMATVAYLSTHSSSFTHWKKLVLDDQNEKVRAAALLCPIETTSEPLQLLDSIKVIGQSLAQEANNFVIRTALHVVNELCDQLFNSDFYRKQPALAQSALSLIKNDVAGEVSRLETSSESVAVRRWCAQTRERVWVASNPMANRLIQRLRPIVSQIAPGRSRRIDRKVFDGLEMELIARCLAIIAQDDFGYDIQSGWRSYKITRGPVFAFRLWRAFFEFSNSATDKRQGISHVTGRLSTATTRIPSQITGELSQTKVPGEPLRIEKDGTWRPFLPLLDDFVSVLNLSWFRRKTVRFYTSQGVTTVTGPKGIIKKLKAFWHLSFRFQKIAELRNWNESEFKSSTYVSTLESLGFEIRFEEHQTQDPPSRESDKSVTRFFSSLACIPTATALTASSFFQTEVWKYLQRFTDYFSAAFENTLEELLIFASVIFVLFVGRHIYQNVTFRRARQNIPLSIGGWGTRGKSGTERLKAALIGVMGHGLVSKTTGCEAMFIHANPMGEPLEIPLFRPYDKATIWEQKNLICMASKLNPSVFLWECMALNPTFVEVLQRQWMNDELATITNTYPDHEDVQGPAGHNVATTISGFVPLNSQLITTEQEMLPYVTESCRLAKSQLKRVGWLESGLITEDVLERFPYQEHPDNIALVAEMAKFLGVEYEFSVKSVADYLVPDLGVLKTHPISNIRTRKIEFTNGMSANERFGCMGNWSRVGFDSQDPWEDPDVWISAVVNNRADRVPRSKVFANIIVEDIAADRYFLIGTNLKGLLGFIDEAWSRWVKKVTLIETGKAWKPENAIVELERLAKRFRKPIEDMHITKKAFAMVKQMLDSSNQTDETQQREIASHWDQPELVKKALDDLGICENLTQAAVRHIDELKSDFETINSFKQRLLGAKASDEESLNDELRQLLTKWHEHRLVVIEDSQATGEEIIGKIVDVTPPGFTNRIMGLQNIKGTGLDFVYCFQAWDVCSEACDALFAKQPGTVESGLQALTSMPQIGQLMTERIQQVIAECKQRPNFQKPEWQTALEQIYRKLDLSESSGEISSELESTNKANMNQELYQWWIDVAEQFLDVNDSVRRREKADLIYKDLAALRISRQRAIMELRKINKRQKGGWLSLGKKEKAA